MASYSYTRYVTPDGAPPLGGRPPARLSGSISHGNCIESPPPPPYTTGPLSFFSQDPSHFLDPALTPFQAPPPSSTPLPGIHPWSHLFPLIPCPLGFHHPPPPAPIPPPPPSPPPPPPPMPWVFLQPATAPATAPATVPAALPKPADPPGAKLDGASISFEDGTSAYIFPEKHTIIHLMAAEHQPWDSPGAIFRFTKVKAPCSMPVKELIRRLGASANSDNERGIVECIDVGGGAWIKGSVFKHSDDKSKQRLEEIGWDGSRGTSRKPVWLAVYKS